MTAQHFPQHYIGLMSGTSMDGVDAALVRFESGKTTVAGVKSIQFATNLRAELLTLNTPSSNELHRAALAANTLMGVYAQAVQAVLQAAGLPAQSVKAIGAHGQTVRHQPGLHDGTGYTTQLVNGALLAELTGIEVVCDFRSRDVAAGGQGAPLAPLFHRAFFGQTDRSVGVLNIGGISNLSVLQKNGATLGFDCGPGNALMDGWCERHTGQAYDAAGAWAGSGQANQALLAQMLAEPYFALPAPKSTGRDLFNAAWLEKQLRSFSAESPANVQATLLELSACSIANSVQRCEEQLSEPFSEIMVCGGGAFNTLLMQRLSALLQGRVLSSAERGLPPQDVEATAFAWLAQQCIERIALPVAPITGALGSRVLGCIYPA
jgi:anhydro-N-acetylmuramic acid kinase